MGDTLQRDMTDWAFRMLTPEVFNPWSDVNSELWQESAEIWRNLIRRALGLPGGNCRIRRRCLTWCAIFQPRCNFPKCRHTRHCLKRSGGLCLDQYSTLWAVEGIGHWYGDTFFTRQEVPRGILRDAYIRDVPEESFTMLNAGIGMSFAQHWIKTVNHKSAPADIRPVVEQITALCRDNATPGYEGQP